MDSTTKNRPRRLSATFVRTVSTPGRYGDGHGGHGLSLLVKRSACGDLTKSWTQAIRPNDRTTSVGLGGYPLVTLAAARERALDNARAVVEGRGPRRRVQRAPTFAQACETVIAIHAENWKGGKNERQWRASLRDYAMPKLARKRVDAITTADVMAMLLPIWSTKRQTARRVRQRIGAVMKWAVAQGHRDDNPAGDAISAALPNNRVATKHQRALPHAEVGAALARVRASGAYLGTKLAFVFRDNHEHSADGRVGLEMIFELQGDCVPFPDPRSITYGVVSAKSAGRHRRPCQKVGRNEFPHAEHWVVQLARRSARALSGFAPGGFQPATCSRSSIMPGETCLS